MITNEHKLRVSIKKALVDEPLKNIELALSLNNKKLIDSVRIEQINNKIDSMDEKQLINLCKYFGIKTEE